MVSSDLRLSQALGVTPTKSMSRMIDLIETFVGGFCLSRLLTMCREKKDQSACLRRVAGVRSRGCNGRDKALRATAFSAFVYVMDETRFFFGNNGHSSSLILSRLKKLSHRPPHWARTYEALRNRCFTRAAPSKALYCVKPSPCSQPGGGLRVGAARPGFKPAGRTRLSSTFGFDERAPSC
jgi:hypothetical protein